jgi:hypothetical protein
MVLVDHLKGVKTDDLIADVAFGRHVATGDMTKSLFDGTKVYVQHILGDTIGKGWSGVEGLWFRGINRGSSKYKFHPGIMSPSNTDTVQGIDTIFDQDTPHSNLAWIRCECPNGSEQAFPTATSKTIRRPDSAESSRPSSAISITAAARSHRRISSLQTRLM